MSTLRSGGGNLFKNTLLEFGHTQINDVISNQAGNILDLVFTNLDDCERLQIQPIIEYSAPVWSPFTKIQIVSIELIQRNFTRYA